VCNLRAQLNSDLISSEMEKFYFLLSAILSVNLFFWGKTKTQFSLVSFRCEIETHNDCWRAAWYFGLSRLPLSNNSILPHSQPFPSPWWKIIIITESCDGLLITLFRLRGFRFPQIAPFVSFQLFSNLQCAPK
jgi:hypothetical protein